MEPLFLYIFIGLVIFGVKVLTQGRAQRLGLPGFIAGGVIAGAVIPLLTRTPLGPAIAVPGTVPVIFGALAGVILYFAETWGITTRPGIRYASTLILGVILGVLAWGVTALVGSVTSDVIILTSQGVLRYTIFLLAGFLTAFGYTFPERWFRQSRNTESTSP